MDTLRITVFMVLFRMQADQARRMDSVDATLGVFLSALLVAAPLVFGRAPTVADRWTAATGFATVIVLVAIALFGINGREVRPGIALLLARDFGTDDRGSYAALREELDRLHGKPLLNPSRGLAIRRGAAGAVAQLFTRDRFALFAKRRLLAAAVMLTFIISVIIGVRDLFQYSTENRHGLISRPGEAASHSARRFSTDPRGRRFNVGTSHRAATMTRSA